MFEKCTITALCDVKFFASLFFNNESVLQSNPIKHIQFLFSAYLIEFRPKRIEIFVGNPNRGYTVYKLKETFVKHGV